MPEWHFEHFKTFYSFEILQQAAASLLLFEGQNTDASKNSKMMQLTEILKENTGHSAWTPSRDTGNLIIDTEGASVFRNKARLLSKFYLCVPLSLLEENGDDKTIVMTNFGRALGLGYVREEEFYDYIIKKFQFPHPAFSNYNDWKASNIVIRPFVVILKTLVSLLETSNPQEAYLTVEEISEFLVPIESEDISNVSETILTNRSNEIDRIANNQDRRKIKEMMAFLAMSQYVYIDSITGQEERFFLNLIDRHSYEKTFYFMVRSASGTGTGRKKFKESKINKIKNLWRE